MTSHEKHHLHRHLALLLLSSLGSAFAAPLAASDKADTVDNGSSLEVPVAAPSQNATVNLINRLVEKGVLSRDDSADLLMLAEADAADARAQAAMTQAALAQAAAAQARARALSIQLARKNNANASAIEVTPQPKQQLVTAPVAPRRIQAMETPAPVSPVVVPEIEEAPVEIQRPVHVAVRPQPVQIVPEAPENPEVAENQAVKVHRVFPRSRVTPPVDETPAPAQDKEVVQRPAPVVEVETVPVIPARREAEAPATETVRDRRVVETPVVREPAPEPVPAAAPVRPDPAEELPALSAEPDEPLANGTVRVAYVPEVVKAQLREEIKQEVLDQARSENWASPRTLPDWVMKFRLFGDLRTRGEGMFYRAGNLVSNGSSFWNFAAINAGAPYDNSSSNLSDPPILNTDQNRNRVRVRARLGANIDLGESFSTGLRFATGDSNSPVSQNQSLGAAGSGQGGNFSKYALWIDRAFMNYELGGLPDKDLNLSVGRFDNPFMSTSMIWADDLGFDGLAAKGKLGVTEGLTSFFSVGAFPVFNTDLNFGTTNATKFKSYDKWLYAAQVGGEMEISNDVNFKLGAAFYVFKNIEGRVSQAMLPMSASDSGETDASRPAFAQKGNTYIALRYIPKDTRNNEGLSNQWQYFGLATPFRVLSVDSKLDLNFFEPFQISVVGEYAKNLAFDRAHVLANGPANLKGPVNNNAADLTTFLGSDSAWNAYVRFGAAALEKRWDWNASVGYRRVGTDAVVDGFADSDFGGGGTNVKGLTVSGNLALSKNVWLGLRWMSATQVAGYNFKNDILQIDLNGKF